MKTYILYNPFAGVGNGRYECEKLLADIEGEAVMQDITEITSYADFFGALEADDKVVLCGGDGTLNRFVNEAAEVTIKNELLYYAVGTGNDFLKDVNKNVGDAPFPVSEYLKDLPTVEVNGKCSRFLNGVGFGVDGYCCEMGDKMKREKPGKPVNYTSIAIKGLLFHYKPANAIVTVDGESFSYKKVWIAAAMKGRYYGGGIMPSPEQDRLAEDGKVTLVVLYGSGKLKTLVVFPSMFKGEHVKHTEMVAIHRGKEISVTFDRPCALQIDGETVLNVTNYKVSAGKPATLEAVEATV